MKIITQDKAKKNQPKETMKKKYTKVAAEIEMAIREKAGVTIITLKRAIQIINQHGNLDEIYYFFKELGHKKEYKLKDVKIWLGY